MLRPATPLSVLLFAAFCLLLLSSLSAPIIGAIPLGQWMGVDFGVFGFCNRGACTPVEIGYDVQQLSSEEFDIPAGTRTTLTTLLIIHPIAALLTLIMFVLAVIAHLHSPSHSSRYLLALFIFGIFTFLVCLLSFLVDVLVFVPHIAWGSYTVLAATVLVAISGLVSCAMRRTIVSRKARKKRIAENAEMSGENYYNRQLQQAPPVSTSPAPQQPTVPMLSGANGRPDALPEFASFEKKDDRSSDERVPLTSISPTDRSPNNYATDGSTTYVNDMGTMPSDLGPQRSLTNTPGSRGYGDPSPGPDGYAMRAPSYERMNSRGRGGGPPGGYRGRGGYPGPGRGGYNGYGIPPGGRGGYGGPQGRGGYGTPPSVRGGYGPPPRGGGGRPLPPSYHGTPGPYDRRPSPAGPYGPGPGQYDARQPSPGPPSAPGYVNRSASNGSGVGYNAYNPGNRESLPRAESPPPLPGIDDGIPTQAVEMDATGSNRGVGQYGIRDSDSDVAGMLAMQQARLSPGARHDTYISDASRYSQDDNTYVPPRQAWNQNPARTPSPLTAVSTRPPVDLHGGPGPNLQPPPSQHEPQTNPGLRPAAGEYYEDVDPRFAEPATAAAAAAPPASNSRPRTPPMQPLQLANSYEEIPQGARSPAESERSNFTSISQRGINPRWQPPPEMPQMIPRRPVGNHSRPTDILLTSNPDFELPTRGRG
ncbi:SUR7/PalI family-domain-containing protein [Triangularia verruculosa]|uniref:SUR7/PalI family-domain-containing protein n=1 Tax=Triangularia verruculosa TaxID=2587418 RepID=A0AAN6XGH4_9PEZI|nr:SUR7/PalI family-domain-containing protein [Triangularia verruculosa]